MQGRVFVAAKGAGFNDEKAQAYGEFIWKLKEENGEVLKPEYVVESARPKASPIHDFFEWDDGAAAEKYRIWQARYLIGRIEVVVKSDGKADQVRAFHNISIKSEEENERGYVTIKDVQENKDYLAIVLENALDEIKSWQKRYAQYQRLKPFKPLRPVFKAISESRRSASA